MITERQREARIAGIGSSDAAAILGYNPHRNAADVRLEKLGLVEPEPAGELAEIGNALEDGIASLAAQRLGVKLVKPTSTYVHPDLGMLRANLDRQVGRAARGEPIVECKDSGIDDGWGDPGTDVIPPMVLIQVQYQMLCSEAPSAHVARLGRGWKRGLFIYEVRRSDELIDAMAKFLPAWWQRHIVDQDPLPEDLAPPNLEVLKRVRREPATRVALDPALVLAWRQHEEAFKAAEAARDEAKARVLDALGTAEGGDCEHGAVTYLEQCRKEHTVAASTFRVMRFKAAK